MVRTAGHVGLTQVKLGVDAAIRVFYCDGGEVGCPIADAGAQL
jgi:hypothetical protein